MKKIIALFLAILTITLIICSCGKNATPVESQITSNSETVMTTTTAETYETIANFETTTEEINIETSFEIIGKYKNIAEERPFEAFMDFRNVYIGKVDITEGHGANYVKFKVLGLQEGYVNTVNGRCSMYYIRIDGIYGKQLKEYHNLIGSTYIFQYFGTPENPLFGRPSLEIGKEYAAMDVSKNMFLRQEKYIGPSLVFQLIEENGVEYAYGNGVDFSGLPFAIKITDEEANKIYKEGVHDREIKQTLYDGQNLPTFDYKCKFEDLIERADKVLF